MGERKTYHDAIQRVLEIAHHAMERRDEVMSLESAIGSTEYETRMCGLLAYCEHLMQSTQESPNT